MRIENARVVESTNGIELVLDDFSEGERKGYEERVFYVGKNGGAFWLTQGALFTARVTEWDRNMPTELKVPSNSQGVKRKRGDENGREKMVEGTTAGGAVASAMGSSVSFERPIEFVNCIKDIWEGADIKGW